MMIRELCNIDHLTPFLEKKSSQEIRLEQKQSSFILPIMATTAELYKKAKDCALHLPVEERSRLAGRLLKSLDDMEGIPTEWLTEIRNRADDIDSGRVTLIEGEDFLCRLNAV